MTGLDRSQIYNKYCTCHCRDTAHVATEILDRSRFQTRLRLENSKLPSKPKPARPCKAWLEYEGLTELDASNMGW